MCCWGFLVVFYYFKGVLGSALNELSTYTNTFKVELKPDEQVPDCHISAVGCSHDCMGGDLGLKVTHPA